MLLSIGYQKLMNVNAFIAILREFKVHIVLDLRSMPYSSRQEFNRANLKKHLEAEGINYRWVGAILGEFGYISEETIKNLADWHIEKRVCLMCTEADPDHCHRKHEIAERLKNYDVKVDHILT